MSRILVTGGSGFIGTNLVQHFAAEGHEVLSLDVAEPRNPEHRPLWKRVDILDREHLLREVQGFAPDHIVHMAARTDLRGASVQDYRANTDGVGNMIAAAQSLPRLERIVFASSMLVCRIGYMPKDRSDYCPTTPYGESKVAGERLVYEAAGTLPWVVVRPTSIWGPWFDVPYKDFFVAVRKGMYFHPKGRKIRRSYGFVGNTVYQVSKLLSCPLDLVRHKTYYLADYEPIELKTWATLIQGAFDARPVREVPLPILRAGARMGDVLAGFGYRKPPLTSFRLANLLTDAVYDLDPLRAVCGPTPFAAGEGVLRTVSWLKQTQQ